MTNDKDSEDALPERYTERAEATLAYRLMPPAMPMLCLNLPTHNREISDGEY
jgi:hypothetical protein